VTTWDTANVYSNGESERVIAKAIKQVSNFLKNFLEPITYAMNTQQFNIPRHRITILTKCNLIVSEDPTIFTPMHPKLRDERNYVNQSGLSRAAIFNQVEASLQRLETDYIDLLQIHRADLDNVSAEVGHRRAKTSAPLLMRNLVVGDNEGAPRPRSDGQGSLHRGVFNVDMAAPTLQSRCRGSVPSSRP
jgi:hypothetical protein